MFILLERTVQHNETLHQEMKNLQTENILLVRHVLEIKDFLRTQRSLPAQVLLQQPVILNDAPGRFFPSSVQFCSSLEGFLAVLEICFEHVGKRKALRVEVDFRDIPSQRPIALRKRWNGVFRLCKPYFYSQNTTCSLISLLTTHRQDITLIWAWCLLFPLNSLLALDVTTKKNYRFHMDIWFNGT